jgi:hypothetical protein
MRPAIETVDFTAESATAAEGSAVSMMKTVESTEGVGDFASAVCLATAKDAACPERVDDLACAVRVLARAIRDLARAVRVLALPKVDRTVPDQCLSAVGQRTPPEKSSTPTSESVALSPAPSALWPTPSNLSRALSTHSPAPLTLSAAPRTVSLDAAVRTDAVANCSRSGRRSHRWGHLDPSVQCSVLPRKSSALSPDVRVPGFEVADATADGIDSFRRCARLLAVKKSAGVH